MKSVMPSFCQTFSKNPQKMMAEMMPMCQETMKLCNMDMPGHDEDDGWHGRKERLKALCPTPYTT